MRLRGTLPLFVRLQAARLARVALQVRNRRRCAHRPRRGHRAGRRGELGLVRRGAFVGTQASPRRGELGLLAPHRHQRLAPCAPGRLDARSRRRAGAAGALALLESRLDHGTFGAQPLARCRIVDRRAGERATEQQRHRAGRAQDRSGRAALHVSVVSTSRRASARNSGDCISARRDAVRTNSCASAPSVYRASGSTCADMTSLTRRS